MRRAAANASRDGGAAAADAQRRLEDALQQIQRRQGGRGQRDIQTAMRQAEELANDQKEISSEVNGLDQAGAQREARSEEHTSELQSPYELVCRLLLEKKKKSRARWPCPLHQRLHLQTRRGWTR